MAPAAWPLIAALWGGWVIYQDLRARRLANALMLAGTVLAGAMLWTTGGNLVGGDWRMALAGAATGLALTLPGYWRGLLGAGDVKLAPVLGALAGPAALLVGTLVAGVLSLAWWGARRQRQNQPYGAFLAFGTLGTGLLLSPLI